MPSTPCDAWVVEHGGAVDGLALRGAALVTTAAVKQGRQLASLPRSVLLSSDDALLPETGLGFVAERFPDVVVPPFMLALLLLLHDARGADSRLAPLLRSLPAAPGVTDSRRARRCGKSSSAMSSGMAPNSASDAWTRGCFVAM